MLAARLIGILLLSLIMMAACGGAGTDEPGTPVLSSSPPASSTGVVATPVPETGASPTTLASGDYLLIDDSRVLALLVPSVDSGPEYAVTEGGLYRLADLINWVKVSEIPAEVSVIVDPTDPNTLYLGGHAPCAQGGEPVQFQKSVDGGQTWRSPANVVNIRPVLVAETDNQLLLGEDCQLAISSDGGHIWRSHQLVPGFDLHQMIVSDTRIYSIYTSEGGTSRLIPVDVAAPGQPVAGEVLLEFWGLGVVLFSEQRLFVGTSQGVQISDDGGRTWAVNRNGLEDVTLSVNPLVEPIPRTESARPAGILSLAVHPVDTNRVFAGTVRGLYLSEDSGENWGLLAEVGEVPVENLQFAHAGGNLYVTTDQGVAVLKNP